MAAMLSRSETYENVMLHIISEQSVCVGEKGQSKKKSDKLDRPRAQPDIERKHYIHWYYAVLSPSGTDSQ